MQKSNEGILCEVFQDFKGWAEFARKVYSHKHNHSLAPESNIWEFYRKLKIQIILVLLSLTLSSPFSCSSSASFSFSSSTVFPCPPPPFAFQKSFCKLLCFIFVRVLIREENCLNKLNVIRWEKFENDHKLIFTLKLTFS